MGNDTKKLLRELKRQGFVVEQAKNNHYVIRKNGVRVATLASTPSDWRGWLNSIADLRRAGFRWTH